MVPTHSDIGNPGQANPELCKFGRGQIPAAEYSALCGGCCTSGLNLTGLRGAPCCGLSV